MYKYIPDKYYKFFTQTRTPRSKSLAPPVPAATGPGPSRLPAPPISFSGTGIRSKIPGQRTEHLIFTKKPTVLFDVTAYNFQTKAVDLPMHLWISITSLPLGRFIKQIQLTHFFRNNRPIPGLVDGDPILSVKALEIHKNVVADPREDWCQIFSTIS